MSDAIEAGAMHAVYERLTRLEERGTARDERIARMEQTLSRLATQMEAVGQDVRDAKTGLRVGLWITSTAVPAVASVAGWFAHTLWGK